MAVSNPRKGQLPTVSHNRSVFGPIIFNIHINDISETCQNTNVIPYADCTEIHASSKDINQAEHCVNQDLKNDLLKTAYLVMKRSQRQCIVFMVTYKVKKTTIKRSPPIRHFFDTVIVVSTNKE